jgi:hypothetical protein
MNRIVGCPVAYTYLGAAVDFGIADGFDLDYFVACFGIEDYFVAAAGFGPAACFAAVLVAGVAVVVVAGVAAGVGGFPRVRGLAPINKRMALLLLQTKTLQKKLSSPKIIDMCFS